MRARLAAGHRREREVLEPREPPYDEAFERDNRRARAVIVSWLTIGLVVGAIQNVRPPPAVTVLAAYLLIAPLMGYSLWLLLRLVRSGEGRLPLPLFVGCVTFMIVGAAFDVGVTVWHSPTLSEEGNPFVRALMDTGHPLAAVYVVGALGQVMVTAGVALLLAAALRHSGVLVRRAWQTRPSSLSEFMRAVERGRLVSGRAVWAPLRSSELMRALNLLCFVGYCSPVLFVARWYLGLQWLDVVGGGMGEAAAMVVAGTWAVFVVLMLWLRSQYAKGPPGTSAGSASGSPYGGLGEERNKELCGGRDADRAGRAAEAGRESGA